MHATLKTRERWRTLYTGIFLYVKSGLGAHAAAVLSSQAAPRSFSFFARLVEERLIIMATLKKSQ